MGCDLKQAKKSDSCPDCNPDNEAEGEFEAFDGQTCKRCGLAPEYQSTGFIHSGSLKCADCKKNFHTNLFCISILNKKRATCKMCGRIFCRAACTTKMTTASAVGPQIEKENICHKCSDILTSENSLLYKWELSLLRPVDDRDDVGTEIEV